jgi:hypothetical protein
MPPTAASRPTVVLHIGAPKTGTSAIQAFLALNRDEFQAATGIHYPQSASDMRALRGKPTAGNGARLAKLLRSRKRDALDNAVAMTEQELGQGENALLLSSEGFWAVPHDAMAAFMDRLRDAASFGFVFYARPQVKHVESAYLQVLGNRGFEGGVDDYFDQLKSRFFVGQKLRSLRELAGAENVTARKYDRKTLVGGDVVDDFLDVFGAQWQDDFVRPPEVNATIDAEHYLYARVTAGLLPPSAAAKKGMRALFDDPLLAPIYAQAAPITGLKVMDPVTAKRICDTYAEDNDLLDVMCPAAGFGFNAENEKALAAIEAEAGEPPKGLSRLEILLLNRVARLEARLANSTSPSDREGDFEDDDG